MAAFDLFEYFFLFRKLSLENSGNGILPKNLGRLIGKNLPSSFYAFDMASITR